MAQENKHEDPSNANQSRWMGAATTAYARHLARFGELVRMPRRLPNQISDWEIIANYPIEFSSLRVIEIIFRCRVATLLDHPARCICGDEQHAEAVAELGADLWQHLPNCPEGARR